MTIGLVGTMLSCKSCSCVPKMQVEEIECILSRNHWKPVTDDNFISEAAKKLKTQKDIDEGHMGQMESGIENDDGIKIPNEKKKCIPYAEDGMEETK